MFLRIAQHSNFLQNIFLSLQTSIHPVILHNIGKIEILKKAFHQVTTEYTEGDYFEFGVYEGTSLYGAATIYNKISSKKSNKFYKKKFERKFYGFDSFDEGFRYSDEADNHPFFREGDFASSYEKCSKRLKKFSNVKLIKGYFEDVLHKPEVVQKFHDKKCSILFIDCDLTYPALVALNFMRPLLQKGTIIILDDYFAYKGNTEHGTYGALQKFLTNFPEVKIRSFFSYGYNGTSFVVYEC